MLDGAHWIRLVTKRSLCSWIHVQARARLWLVLVRLRVLLFLTLKFPIGLFLIISLQFFVICLPPVPKDKPIASTTCYHCCYLSSPPRFHEMLLLVTLFLAHSVPATIEEPVSHLLRCHQCPGVGEVRFPLRVLIAGTQQCDANKGDLVKVLMNPFWTDWTQRMGT